MIHMGVVRRRDGPEEAKGGCFQFRGTDDSGCTISPMHTGFLFCRS